MNFNETSQKPVNVNLNISFCMSMIQLFDSLAKSINLRSVFAMFSDL